MSEPRESRNRKPKSRYVDFTRRKGFGGRSRPNRSDKTVGFRELSDMNTGRIDGFLITSMTGQEYKSYSEVRELLEQYHTEIYGNQRPPHEAAVDDSERDPMFAQADQSEADERVKKLVPFFAANEQEKDLGDELEDELKQMRSIRRHFRQLKTFCKNVIYIAVNERVSQADPDIMVRRIFDDIAENKQQQTRYTFKVYPMMSAFRANPTSAKEAVTTLINEKLSDQSAHPLANKTALKYFIEFQVRGSYTAGKEERERLIEAVAAQVGTLKPDWTVSRENCDIMIMIVALQKLCCMSLLTNYFHYTKYNIHEFNRKHVPDFDDKSTEKPAPREPRDTDLPEDIKS